MKLFTAFCILGAAAAVCPKEASKPRQVTWAPWMQNKTQWAKRLEIDVSNFSEMKAAIEDAGNAVQLTINVMGNMTFTSEILIEEGQDITIKSKTPGTLMAFDANGASNENNNGRRHFEVEGQLELMEIDLTNGFRTGNNVPQHTGGSITVNGEAARFTCTRCGISLNHCHKEGNAGSYTGGGGGAVYVLEGNVLLESCSFYGNEAFSQNGGNSCPNRIGGGQDIYADSGSSIIIRNSNFAMSTGNGDDGWARTAYVQNSEPYVCADTVGGYPAACYGPNSGCDDRAQDGEDWGVGCYCNAGYRFDYSTSTCVDTIPTK
jgi:hypothetical protein